MVLVLKIVIVVQQLLVILLVADVPDNVIVVVVNVRVARVVLVAVEKGQRDKVVQVVKDVLVVLVLVEINVQMHVLQLVKQDVDGVVQMLVVPHAHQIVILVVKINVMELVLQPRRQFYKWNRRIIMEIQIGNFNRSIKSFNVSSRRQGEDIIRTQLTIDCIDIGDDVEYISNSITKEMEENIVKILNEDLVYNFPEYEFNSVDKYVSESSSRLSITFIK